MWEYNSDQQRFGTPEALMTLPYWTNNCVDSMEGLYFESSPTTPYHFLDQSELSAQPSDAQAGLPYGGLERQGGRRAPADARREVLPRLLARRRGPGQRRSPAHARGHDQGLARTGDTWRIYVIKNSPMVQGTSTCPTWSPTSTSRVDWLNANVTWWLNPHLWSDGRRRERAEQLAPYQFGDSMNDVALPAVKVSDVVVHTQSISFHVSRVGVPVW
jgi:hypothetical protein